MDIPLTNGGVALVDDDQAYLTRFVWSRTDRHSVSYAVRRERQPDGTYKMIRMHREIMGVQGSKEPVDHISGDGLDNRRSNLRVCTQTENVRNVAGSTRRNTTGYRGVSRHKGRFRARILVGKKKVSLGLFDTPELANIARLKAERMLWGITPRRADDHAAVVL